MTRLLLTRVTKLRGRIPEGEKPDLEQLRKEDPSVISVEYDHTRTVITTVWDVDAQMSHLVEEGHLPYKLPLMVMINNWRRYNQNLVEYVQEDPNLYYTSKTLYWHFDYA